MDILQYINKMNRLYGNDSTPERFNTRQYLQGGRVGMKPGGLVEPGVTHYGREKKHERTAADIKADVSRTGRPQIPPTLEHEKIAQKIYKKSFDELEYYQQSNIRTGKKTLKTVIKDPLTLLSNVERVMLTEKRMKKFETKFIKENGRLPSQKEYTRLGKFDFESVKKAVNKGIVKTLPLNLTKGLAGQQAVYKDLVKLAGKESVKNIFKKGKPTKTDINVVANALGTKDKTVATRRLYQLASAFANEIQVPGIKPQYVKSALKIMDESPYNSILRGINELQIGKSVGEKSLASIRAGIRKIPEYIFSGDYNIDEPAGIQSSVRRGSTPYGVFGQVIRKELNMGEKKIFDRMKSVKERILKQAILEGDPKEIDTALKNFNRLISDYETKLNVDTPKGAPKVRLFRASLDSPEVTIKNFASFNKEYQKAFMDNFKNQRYSFHVPKDIKTLPQIKEAVQNPNTIKRMTQLFKNFSPRLLSALPGVFGAGAVGAAALLHGTSTEAATPKKEVTKSSMIPKIISENPYTSAAVGTGAALTQKPVRSLLGKTVRTLGTPLAGPAFAAWTASNKMKAGESLADAVIDPVTGAELALPGMFKENLAKITKNPRLMKLLSLGYKIPKTAMTVGRLTTPVGWGIAGVGAVRDAYKDYQRRKPYIEKIKEQRRKGEIAEEQFDEDFTTY